jgi:hypothetical protein
MAMENPRASGDRAHERGASGLDKVARELAVLFEGADLVAADAADAPRQAKLRSMRRSQAPSERRFAAVGGVVAAALAGVAAGALIGRAHPFHPSRPATPVQTPAAAQAVAQGPTSSWDDSMIVYAPSRRTAKPAASAHVAPARSAKPARTASRPKAAKARRTSSRCADLGRHGRVACQRRMLRAADGNLRRAYARAIRARAPRAVLLRYRNDWAQLRRQAVRRPEQTAAAYNQLARELARAARRGPRGRR